ncbi:hypothetical protein HPB49_023620 [Dermacentor silvarum]|uniref:Uncharacterized protein n=1 Tax=Dermacentor silvarum TaxID=543639 RepID=A0ACB8DLH8_DERSI|nr:hypothetical protein HPB49_023620 [Dermacentor silvarum]
MGALGRVGRSLRRHTTRTSLLSSPVVPRITPVCVVSAPVSSLQGTSHAGGNTLIGSRISPFPTSPNDTKEEQQRDGRRIRRAPLCPGARIVIETNEPTIAEPAKSDGRPTSGLRSEGPGDIASRD